jgi:aryl-alcohol dehydrogenase-like predicted oxidoreductase
MSLGHVYGHGGSDEERFAYLDRAYELGETNWDTANVYGDVEDVVGKWFERTGKRNEIFLATKFGFMNPMEPTNIRTDPENVFESCENSLKRLQTEWIDLFYCHRVDGKTPIEKTVQAMVELKK